MIKNTFIKNISYSFLANFLSFLISTVMFFITPKILSVEEYGYWQLFLFYFSFVGFFHFGWEDGIFLRYAGKSFENLNKRVLSGQFWGIIIVQLLIALTLAVTAFYLVIDPVKRMILLGAIVLLPVSNFNNLCSFIMQITNRIQQYAAFIVVGRVVFLALVVGFIFVGVRQWYGFYVAQATGLILVSLYSTYLCRSFLASRGPRFIEICGEAIKNISAGMQLMLANIAGLLLIGIVRYGISEGWDIASFGKVSLSLSIANFLMVFIGAVSVSFFPVLKQTAPERLPSLYLFGRNLLMISLLGLMIGYYPLKTILGWWLPQYQESLKYLVILFPICLFESKMNLLVNTYLKSLRKERSLLAINLLSVAVSVVLTVITVDILHNLELAIFSIIVLYGVRCVIAELYMERLLHIRLKKAIMEEVMMVSAFILTGWISGNWLCMLFYGVIYMGYLAWHRNLVIGCMKKLSAG